MPFNRATNIYQYPQTQMKGIFNRILDLLYYKTQYSTALYAMNSGKYPRTNQMQTTRYFDTCNDLRGQ